MARKRKVLNFNSSDLWYFVGLLATDGCLSSDGRHIDITAKDKDFLTKLNDRFVLSNKLSVKNKSKNNQAYCISFSNKNFYDFLVSIGLTPNKSLTLGEIKVPDEWFGYFLRGVIDGDGSIRSWLHPSNGIEQWSLRLYSASNTFIEWLKNKIEDLLLVKGKIHKSSRVGRYLYVLKYGKISAKIILRNCYSKNSLSLDRKARLAESCCRSQVKWKKSKLLLGSH